jgi:hypothetical protein
VLPIAMQVSIRRTKMFGTKLGTGDEGCHIKIVKSPAEIMNKPSSAASQRYSGQWSRSARIMVKKGLVSSAEIQKRRSTAVLQSTACEMFCVSFGSAMRPRIAFAGCPIAHGRMFSMFSRIRYSPLRAQP